MKGLKRILCILIVFVFMFPAIVVGAVSQEETYISKGLLLKTLDIAKLTPKGELLPQEENISKEEFVYMVVKAMNVKNLSKPFIQDFRDVPVDNMYSEYISIAKSLNIVSGGANEKFGLGESININQAVKMIVVGLGMGDLAILKGGYPSGYMKLAIQYDIVGNNKYNDSLKRNEAVDLIYNMLDAPVMELSTISEKMQFDLDNNINLLKKAFNVTKYKGVVTGNSITSLTGNLNSNQIEIGGEIFRSEVSAKDLIGETVRYYYRQNDENKNDAIIYLENINTNTKYEIASEQLNQASISGKNIEISYRINDKNISKSIPLKSSFIYNEKYENFDIKYINNLKNKKNSKIIIVENDKKEYTIKISDYSVMVVSGVSVSDNIIWGKCGEVLKLNSVESTGKTEIYKSNEVISLDKVENDDVLNIIQSKDELYTNITIVNNRVTGTVTSLEFNQNSAIYIDGIKYGINEDYLEKTGNMGKIKVGLLAEFVFDLGGNLIYLNILDSKGNYGFLVNIEMKEGFEQSASFDFIDLSAKKVSYPASKKISIDDATVKNDLVATIKGSKLVDSGKIKRQLVYYELQKDEVSKIYCAKDGSSAVSKEERNHLIDNNIFRVTGKLSNKKFKYNTASFLPDTDDSKSPEFYLSRNAKILIVPPENSTDEEFSDVKSYSNTSWNSYIDADNYMVEAYNGNQYNECGIMLFTTSLEQSLQELKNFVIVDGYGQKLNASGDSVEVLQGYMNGMKISVEAKNESVFTHMVNETQVRYTSGDVVQFSIQNDKAIASQYRANINSELIFSQEGKNNGILCTIGELVSSKDEYITVKTSDNGNERVFRCDKSAFNIMVTDLNSRKTSKGTFGDLVPGSKIIIRANYTLAQECIIIK